MRSTRLLTIVIKLGTSSICHEKTHEPLISNLSLLVETVVRLRREGHRVILVSSGAIGIGLRKLGLDKRPKLLSKCQAIAAIGQCELVAIWDKLFSLLGQTVAQVLLTRNDIVDRTQYRNAANTFNELLNMGVVPIVNENDTIAVSEIKFGDNDTLSGITAGMVNADYLFLMTDVDCLYDKNPRTHPDAKPIMVVEDISTLEVDVSTLGSAVGTGGMATKLVAAKLATSAGVTTIITRSSVPSNIFHIVEYCQSIKTTSQTQTPMRTTSPPLRHLTSQSTGDPVGEDLEAAATKLEGVNILSPSPSTESLTSLVSDSSVDTLSPFPSIDSATTVTFPSRDGAATPTSSHPTPLGSTMINTPTSEKLLPKVPLHTRFLPRGKAVRDRHFWLLHGLKPHGTIYIDQGAYNALTRSNRAGLLAVGIVKVTGEFHQLEAVSLTVVQRSGSAAAGSQEDISTIVAEDVGRAIVNYSSTEIARIKGHRSRDISAVLGYADTEYISFRDNTAFFPKYEKGVEL
ncbi:hypothetical protein H072_7984 [Dactylellina haptotyla CBS 200.50]|uniref:PUA domain-containing protein n=1 Tax=Dactylellina haptotyla (strain CBS 200.50) TaxID=1284197 RepID=S8A5V1_DACHA|nr:hypothetical protein H072_7984 [Dactylellina haptotyla CBS 200.50]